MAGITGFIFSYLHIPAGWLIGSLLFAMFYRLFVSKVTMPPRLFDFALALIGVNIGLTMNLNMVPLIAGYSIPLFICLILMLAGAWLLSKILTKWSTMDSKTALFCCMPGGASVMMALSEQYKADQPIVAAFQSARVILLVSSMPIFAGLIAHSSHKTATVNTTQSQLFQPIIHHLSQPVAYLLLVIMILGAVYLSTRVKIAAGSFLYAMLIGLLINQFLVQIPPLPDTIVGLGQVILGVIIGVRFDREAFTRLKQMGLLSLGVLLMYIVLSFVISLLFYFMTSLDIVTSLLSMVPGGAPQMASTAAILHLNASIVASLQLVRLLIIFLLIPVIIPFLIKKQVHSNS